MAVSSYRELGRTFENAAGQNVVATRRFVVIFDDNQITAPTPTQQVLSALGVTAWGAVHPEYGILKFRKIRVAEVMGDNPYHCEVNLEYGILTDNQLLTPTSRTPEWSFEQVAGERVPALYYYSESGNGTTYPLTNSANDYFEGLTVEESLTQATIKKNYSNRPSDVITSFGHVNSDSFAGYAAHTCKHVGSKIEYVTEEWGNSIVKYWRAESNVLFRATSWNLLIPDVGYNFLASGEKRRCMVFDFNNDEWIPSPTPVGLDGSGNQTAGRPAVLTRRVHPETSFTSMFGSPPA